MPDERILLVTGTDGPGIEEAARAAVRHLTGDNPPAESLEIFRERLDLSPVELLTGATQAILSPPFLGGDKTVWLHLDGGFPTEGAAKGRAENAAAALRRLAEALDAGLPASISLVLSGTQDRKTPLQRLPAAVEKAGGRVRLLNRPEFGNFGWERDMAAIIRRRAAEKKMDLPEDVVEYLLDILGTDTGRLSAELEKLLCHAGGPGQPVTLANAQAVCLGDGEANDWTLLDALRTRNHQLIWAELGSRLAREKDPDSAVLRLLGLLSREFSAMLQLQVFAQTRGLRSARDAEFAIGRLTPEEKAALLRKGFTFLGMNSFPLKKLMPSLGTWSGRDLVRLIPAVRDAWWAVVSGAASDKRTVLESVLLQLKA